MLSTTCNAWLCLAQYCDDTCRRVDVTSCNQTLDTRYSGCRSRLATDTIASDHRLSICDFIFANRNNVAARLNYGTWGFLPGDRSPDFDGAGECPRVQQFFKQIIRDWLNGKAGQITIAQESCKRCSPWLGSR